MRVLVVNAGSSSLKLALLNQDDSTIAERELHAPRSAIEPEQVAEALEGDLGAADAVAHRIVHGGERFRCAVRVDAEVMRTLRGLTDLAPLHQTKSLAALEAVTSALPDAPAVACFDTAFHTTIAPAAATYALPSAWRERWPLRRFGFHGLSHGWIARRAPELAGRCASDARIVSCHLGAGASLCAIRDGRSVDTTMGFTPLEGLVMATRSGSVDPGLLLWLLDHEGIGVNALGHALEYESGLLGLAGTSDMREVLERAAAGEETATLALEVYIHALAAGVAAMAASLGGLDVLAFTGGVGERAREVRTCAAERLAFLGVELDRDRNAKCDADADLASADAPTRTLVIRAREDLEMAQQARAVLER